MQYSMATPIFTHEKILVASNRSWSETRTRTNDDIVQPGLSDFGYKGKSYAIVAVSGKNINLKLFTVDGQLVDNFTFSK